MPSRGGQSPLGSVISTEKKLVETPAVELFDQLGWAVANLYGETPGPTNSTGRLSFRNVYLPARLRGAVQRLNPHLPAEALDAAIDELTRDRSAMLPVRANEEVLRLVWEGVPVETTRPDGSKKDERAHFIRWTDPAANDFFLAQQFWIESELYKRRADLVGFVNGIPLLCVELKAAQENVSEAYDANLRDYRDTIPRLFQPNAFVIVSNGDEALAGPSHATFREFAAWKKEEEEQPNQVGLEVLLRATCAPARFLDIVQNFIAFEAGAGSVRKILAKYHQVLGVNRAIDAIKTIADNHGRLGVFWHTQGSGKSLSMIFFTEKVLRTIGNNWTFVIVTDRAELDDQIAQTFASVGALGAKKVRDAQAQTREHLKSLLSGNERYVFTLIQKFGTDRGEVYPQLSERSDIVVITDEAHRSQYDQLAANMRRALPNAAFIGFTGTPLMAGEELTREVFGDYISVYNFAQSVADGSTVPLYYESRKPELHLAKDDLKDELDALLEEADLDEEQMRRVETQFARQYHLITRESRLEKIAEDLVRHFSARGYRGKAMFVAIDKATAVRMFQKVQRRWIALLAEEEAQLGLAQPDVREAISEKLRWMRTVDMAVVVSQSQNEIADLKGKGLDILPHRKRMQTEDLAQKFKDPEGALQLVFVCAMWMTGFDVPTCSTMYIDKPMKNHTLMQSIARANRQASGKDAGLIVDYVGVFENLQRALAIYAIPATTDLPARDKGSLLEQVVLALAEAEAYCESVGAGISMILATDKFERVKRIADAREVLIAPDDRRRHFLHLADAAIRAYKAMLPDDSAEPFLRRVGAIAVVADAIRKRLGYASVSKLSEQIEALLDANIDGIDITAPIIGGEGWSPLVDLSAIDFGKLAEVFKTHPRTAADDLRSDIEARARGMAEQNPTRADFIERIEHLVATYNAATIDVQAFFIGLKKLLGELDEEGRRAAREDLTEDELAVFDILTKPTPDLSSVQRVLVKRVARDLMEKLRDHLTVIQWEKRQQTRAAVQTTIREVLNTLPEEPYPQLLWDVKVDATWQFILSHWPGPSTLFAFG